MNDRELKRIALEFRKGILAGSPSDMMCFAICAPLESYLVVCHEFVTHMEEVDFGCVNHCWLRLEDGRILDPTADQFSGKTLKLPKVYLGEVPEIYAKWMAEAGRQAERMSR